ncbi:ATP-binding protein [Viridibacterium curvum]|uniref:histidine kinase n=1 Tax=Viridibacterium curvum TaxID=1101404 RepID=A0ABP9R181_9RHOO
MLLKERLAAWHMRPWLLAASLLLLHLGLLQGVMTPLGRVLMLCHLGSVLMWQPLVRQDSRVGLQVLAIGLLVIGVLGFWMSPGLALLWMLVLSGVLGAELFREAKGPTRLSFWVAEAYLIVALIGLVLPAMLPQPELRDEFLARVVSWGAPLLFPMIPWLARRDVSGQGREQRALDFLGGVVIVLVLSGVLLGALALMFISGLSYLVALLQSLALMAVGLMLLGWVWSPAQGAGLSLAVARHALSGEASFAQWLDQLARLSASDEAPEMLVEKAVRSMLDQPEVLGVDWRIRRGAQDQAGFAGTVAQRRSVLTYGALELGLHSRYELAAMQLWQLDLMVRLLAEFHAAREQARHLQSISYLRAVHETGARMTHEIKNLLQSIDTLCFAMTDAERTGRSEAVQGLLSRQLPVISQRLHTALDNIRQPAPSDVRQGKAVDWWEALQARHPEDGVRFVLDGDISQIELPVLLFDTVADNLMRNAFEKAGAAGDVVVRLKQDNGRCRLSVQDGGAPVEAARAEVLFLRPLPSDRGLGIGLYQAARLADSLGYRLRLVSNMAGAVCFDLAPQAAVTQ